MSNETKRFLFSLALLAIGGIALFFAMPVLQKKAGAAAAEGYWEAEQKANDKRLFPGSD